MNSYKINKFSYNSCGPDCLYYISKYYSKRYLKKYIYNLFNINKDGVSILNLCEAAKKIDFFAIAVRISFKILYKIPLPCIALINNNHYIVINKITKNNIYITDPYNGHFVYYKKDFKKPWFSNRKYEGIVIIIEPLKNHVNYNK